MKIPLYQVDAFATSIFQGNPAAVCALPYWIKEDTMQNIAMENNLSETAFFVKNNDAYDIRWFTPTTEVDLCGHATVATAYCVFRYFQKNATEIVFHTSKKGDLKVEKQNDCIILDFPLETIKKVDPPKQLISSLGTSPQETYKSNDDYLLIYKNSNDIVSITPDFKTLAQVESKGIIISAPGIDVDFVSRFFAPRLGVNEDPVTGSAHTKLTPYWADRLNKTDLTATQLSRRGGFLRCTLGSDRVYISGKAQIYLEGTIDINSEQI